jgi:hypothetical protein
MKGVTSSIQRTSAVSIPHETFRIMEEHEGNVAKDSLDFIQPFC